MSKSQSINNNEFFSKEQTTPGGQGPLHSAWSGRRYNTLSGSMEHYLDGKAVTKEIYQQQFSKNCLRLTAAIIVSIGGLILSLIGPALATRLSSNLASQYGIMPFVLGAGSAALFSGTTAIGLIFLSTMLRNHNPKK